MHFLEMYEFRLGFHKFVPKVRISNIPAFVQIMAWRLPGDKPLSEPMMISLLTHICVTRPQWVNGILKCHRYWDGPWKFLSFDIWATGERYVNFGCILLCGMICFYIFSEMLSSFRFMVKWNYLVWFYANLGILINQYNTSPLWMTWIYFYPSMDK